jgi:hypothetical protein
MAFLPVDHVETDTDSDVTGAGADLTDSNDATAVRISSAADAEWFVYYSSGVPAEAVSVTIACRFDVISSTGAFVTRVRLQDPDFLTYVEGTVTLDDGLNDVSVTVNAGFLASPPADWIYNIDGGDNTVAGLAAALGTTPLLYVAGFDGEPYEVDLTRAVVSYALATTGVQPRRIFQRSL